MEKPGGRDPPAARSWIFLSVDPAGLTYAYGLLPHGLGLRRRSACERLIHTFVDRSVRLSLDFCDLADNQELGSVEHSLFAKGKALLATQMSQPLEHECNLVDASC